MDGSFAFGNHKMTTKSVSSIAKFIPIAFEIQNGDYVSNRPDYLALSPQVPLTGCTVSCKSVL